jgi:hypothetical protein
VAVNSSTSSSKTLANIFQSRAVRILVLTFLLVASVDIGVKSLSDDSEITDNASLLFVQPHTEGIYFLGNSMFKTGIDFISLEETLPEITIDFEYHNGHYTNLWYLIAKSALENTEESPRFVIWGFRPRMALDPAFRQNQTNDTDLFAFDDPLYNTLKDGEDFSRPSFFSPDYVRLTLDRSTGLHPQRDIFQEWVKDKALKIGFKLLETLNISSSTSLKNSLDSMDRSLADEIAQLLTGGAITFTEETVVDTKGDFISGPQRNFEDGYIPATSDAFKAADIQQVIIIWRPVNVAIGNPHTVEDQFVADSLRFFSQQGIPVINLYDDSSIGRSFFASGDHYNAQGRAYVTDLLGEFLSELIAEESDS